MKALLGYEIDVRIDDDRWHDLGALEPHIYAAIGAAMEEIDGGSFSELSIALLNDVAMQALNKTYREQDKPTNVLSFPTENSPVLGDIVLAQETLVREANEKNIPLIDHVQHLLIHGFLHLQGYDHETDQEAKQMEALEVRALKRLGITNPYDIKAVL